MKYLNDAVVFSIATFLVVLAILFTPVVDVPPAPDLGAFETN